MKTEYAGDGGCPQRDSAEHKEYIHKSNTLLLLGFSINRSLSDSTVFAGFCEPVFRI